jgi:hypothetical protein
MAKPSVPSDVFTAMTFIAFVVLAVGVGVLVYKNTQLVEAPWYDVASWFTITTGSN